MSKSAGFGHLDSSGQISIKVSQITEYLRETGQNLTVEGSGQGRP
jgi:hypothetical protein